MTKILLDSSKTRVYHCRAIIEIKMISTKCSMIFTYKCCSELFVIHQTQLWVQAHFVWLWPSETCWDGIAMNKWRMLRDYTVTPRNGVYDQVWLDQGISAPSHHQRPPVPSPCLWYMLFITSPLSTLIPWCLLCGTSYSRCFGCKGWRGMFSIWL